MAPATVEAPPSMVAFLALCFGGPFGVFTCRSAERPLPSRARALAWDEVGRVTFAVSDARRRLMFALPIREHLIFDDALVQHRRGRVIYRPAGGQR